jgi:hypothetical protein
VSSPGERVRTFSTPGIRGYGTGVAA